jgi:predicted Zn-dependent protease with MMP-like domain
VSANDGRGAGRLSDEECREAVREALDSLPAEIAATLGEVAVLVEDRHPDGLMGIYDPSGGLQRIVIFRQANPTAAEVRRTVLHEVGHHFGMSEAQIRGLGYG